MSTSGVTSSTMTTRDVIQSAFELLGVLRGGENPSSEDAELAVRHLNWMLKSMQADGCNLWREQEYEVVFPATVSEVLLTPRVIDVQEARVVIAPTFFRPLSMWGDGEWDSIPNKLANNSPTVFNIRKTRTGVYMRLWGVPVEDTTIVYTAARVIDDVANSNLNDEIDVPQEWLECVYYNLAARLAVPFGQAADQSAVPKIEARAASLYDLLRNHDRQPSIFMGPW